MRIALDARAASHPQRGGFKTYTHELMRHLAQVVPENEYVFYLDRPIDTQPFEHCPNVKFKVLPSRAPLVGAAWREQVELPWHLARDQAAVAHFPTNTATLRTPCPNVVTVHDTISWEERPTIREFGPGEYIKRWGMYFYNRKISIRAARNADRVITVSEYSKRELVRRLGIPPERVVVTYHAPSDIYRPIPRNSAWESVRSKFGLTQPYLLALSSASPRKNVLGLVAEYARLESDLLATYQLVIVWTHGLLKDQLALEVRNRQLEGRVIFLENIDDDGLLELYNAASLFVFPSLIEGFGLPPLEAMACRTPVIASNTSCLPEILGDAAFLVDPRMPGELAAGLATTLRDPNLLRELSKEGSTRVQRYSWQRCAKETAEVYVRAFDEHQARTNG